MRQDQTQIVTSGDMSGSVSSNGIDLQQVYVGSIQAVWTGTPTGNLTVEISNDKVAVGVAGNPSSNVVNWTTLSGSTVAAGGAAGNTAWLLADIGYRWVRLKYTFGSSTGVLQAMWCGKGA